MKSFTEFTESKDGAKFIFEPLSTEVLLAIARGKVNTTELAKKELDSRGVDYKTGQWSPN